MPAEPGAKRLILLLAEYFRPLDPCISIFWKRFVHAELMELEEWTEWWFSNEHVFSAPSIPVEPVTFARLETYKFSQIIFTWFTW